MCPFVHHTKGSDTWRIEIRTGRKFCNSILNDYSSYLYICIGIHRNSLCLWSRGACIQHTGWPHQVHRPPTNDTWTDCRPASTWFPRLSPSLCIVQSSSHCPAWGPCRQHITKYVINFIVFLIIALLLTFLLFLTNWTNCWIPTSWTPLF